MATYTLPDLDYDPGALEPHYSGHIVELHHGKHHAAYVAGANKTIEALAAAREAGDYSKINQLEVNLAFHLGGHVLHSMFWKNMSPEGGGRPEGELAAAIDDGFGGFDAFQAHMTQVATTIQGSGWAVLSWEPLGKRLIVQQLHDHQGNLMPGSLPLLALDMWEHAFYLQFENRKAEWLGAFWKVANWADVARRFEGARNIDFALAGAAAL